MFGAACVVAASIMTSAPAFAQFNPNVILGGAAGALIGGGVNGGKGAVAGAIIGVAMTVIINELTERERVQREAALKKAASNGRATWRSSGKTAKTARYEKVGTVQAMGSQKCQQVRETITLSDGREATSVENVCFS